MNTYYFTNINKFTYSTAHARGIPEALNGVKYWATNRSHSKRSSTIVYNPPWAAKTPQIT